MNGYYERKIKEYNEEKRLIRQAMNKITKRTLIFLDMLLVILVTQLGIILATNENVIKPKDNQYLELRTVEVKEVEGENKQVIMELWANNLQLKGFDIYFSYDHTKLQPSVIETNEITEEEKEYFRFEEEFKEALELFTIPTGKNGEIRGVVTYNPPIEETEHIVEKAGIGKVIDSKGSVLLGKMSFQMTGEQFDIEWFKVIENPTITLDTGVKISQDGTKYFEDTTALRFTDYKVEPEGIKAIEIGKEPKTGYKYGEILNIDGGTIILTTNKGEKKEIEIKQSMVSGYNPNKLGNQILTITYEGKTTTYEVKIEDYLKDIRIEKPKKLIYKIGEDEDITGGKVIEIMASGEEKTPIEMTDERIEIEGFDTTEKGAKLVTVTYEGHTKGFGITVIEEIENIELKELPIKTEYLYGEELDVSGGKIEITNEEGEKEIIEITKEMVTGYNPEEIGEQKLTIKYEELEIEYIVNVEDYEVSLKIEKPNKIEYEYGEEIDLTGGKVSIIMASGQIKETVELMNYMITGYDKENVGEQIIEVEHKGFKGQFKVTVEDKIKNIAMNNEPNKTQYKYGEKIDISGGTIRVVKSSGSVIIPLTMDMISGYNATVCGTQIITVTYQGYKTQFIVTVDKEAEKPTEEKPTIDNGTIGGNGQNTTQKPDGNTEKPIIDGTIEEPQDPTVDNSIEKPEDSSKDEEVSEEKPTETLGEQDKKETKISKTKVITATIMSVIGCTGIILIVVIARKNVKIYIMKNAQYKLIGKDKITKNKLIINIDKYLNEETSENEIKIEISKSISKKLNKKEIDIIYRKETIKRKINYENKLNEIYLK